jgi:hypothetical protein
MPSPWMSSDTTPSPLRQQPSAETTGRVRIPNADGVRLVPSSSTRGLAFSRAHYPAAAFVRYRPSCSRPSVPTGWPLWRPSRSVVDEALDTRDQIASRRSGSCSVGSNRKPRARPGAGSWLSLLVRPRSEGDVDEGGRSPTRARARCACRSRGSGRQQAHGRLPQSRQSRSADRSLRTPGVASEATGCASGEKRVAGGGRTDTCLRAGAGIRC